MSFCTRALAIVVLLAAAAKPVCGQAPARVLWSSRGEDVSALRSGVQVMVTLTASIAPDWHIYSLTQKSGGPSALSISVPPGQPFVLAGAVSGPKPEVEPDATLGIPIELHSGIAEFRVPLRLVAGSSGDVLEGHIVARYQACSSTICLPPRSITLPVRLQQRTRDGAAP